MIFLIALYFLHVFIYFFFITHCFHYPAVHCLAAHFPLPVERQTVSSGGIHMEPFSFVIFWHHPQRSSCMVAYTHEWKLSLHGNNRTKSWASPALFFVCISRCVFCFRIAYCRLFDYCRKTAAVWKNPEKKQKKKNRHFGFWSHSTGSLALSLVYKCTQFQWSNNAKASNFHIPRLLSSLKDAPT